MEQHLQFPRCLDGYFDTTTRHQGMIRLIDVLPVFGDKGIYILMRAMDECGFAHLGTVLRSKLFPDTNEKVVACGAGFARCRCLLIFPYFWKLAARRPFY